MAAVRPDGTGGEGVIRVAKGYGPGADGVNRPGAARASAGGLRGPIDQPRLRAIASISTRPPFGNAPTANVERAGGGSGMNRA